MARAQELIVAFGKNKQADISTAAVAGELWRLGKLNAQFGDPQWVTENDAAELGKGNEFAANIYKSHVMCGFSIEKYLSSEFAAWLFAFGLGKVTESGSGSPYTYTCKPLVPATDGFEPPYFSYAEQLASIGRDIQLVGCAVKSFRVAIGRGPGRGNARAYVECVGSGRVVNPSSLTLPSATAEHLLNAYGAAITINGVDYVAANTFQSCEIGWDNAFLDGFRPGSGQQNGYQVQGAFEIGNRVPAFSFVARYASGSTELAKVRDLTTGTATVTVTADSSNEMAVTFEKMAFSAATLGEADGRVVVQVTGIPMADPANSYDVIQAVVKCPVTKIAQAAA